MYKGLCEVSLFVNLISILVYVPDTCLGTANSEMNKIRVDPFSVPMQFSIYRATLGEKWFMHPFIQDTLFFSIAPFMIWHTIDLPVCLFAVSSNQNVNSMRAKIVNCVLCWSSSARTVAGSWYEVDEKKGFSIHLLSMRVPSARCRKTDRKHREQKGWCVNSQSTERWLHAMADTNRMPGEAPRRNRKLRHERGGIASSRKWSLTAQSCHQP